MYTINFKGKPHPKDGKLVKLDMILFQTGYPRVSIIYERTKFPKEAEMPFTCQGGRLQISGRFIFNTMKPFAENTFGTLRYTEKNTENH